MKLDHESCQCPYNSDDPLDGNCPLLQFSDDRDLITREPLQAHGIWGFRIKFVNDSSLLVPATALNFMHIKKDEGTTRLCYHPEEKEQTGILQGFSYHTSHVQRITSCSKEPVIKQD